MWVIDDVEAVQVELDMTASEQGRRPATRIVSSGVVLFNALELIDASESTVQVLVCEACGFTDCEPGNRVVFRRLGDRVVWTPDWDALANAGVHSYDAHPPAFFRTKGVPLFAPSCWARLRTRQRELPSVSALTALDSLEVARLCQWTAPGAVLGAFPAEPRLVREKVVGVTEGDLGDAMDAVDDCLRESCRDPRPVDASCDGHAAAPIELWLDGAGTSAWTAFARFSDTVGYLLGDVAVTLPSSPGRTNRAAGYEPSQ